MPEITTYKRESAFAELSSFDPLAKDDHFIEVTLWYNGAGFDVRLISHTNQSFLIKELDK